MESKERNVDKIINHGNSGTVGVDVAVGFRVGNRGKGGTTVGRVPGLVVTTGSS